MNEKTARGTACGRLCVLRQCFNRLYQSCPITENMFVKVKTKEYCKLKLLMSCSRRFGVRGSSITSFCLCLRE